MERVWEGSAKLTNDRSDLPLAYELYQKDTLKVMPFCFCTSEEEDSISVSLSLHSSEEVIIGLRIQNLKVSPILNFFVVTDILINRHS